jgi:hypothetical protein
LNLENFYADRSDTVHMETCRTISSATHCIRATEVPTKRKRKDCRIDRLIFSPADANRPAMLVTETVSMNGIKAKKSCIGAYFDREGKEDSTIGGGRECDGKRSE